MSSASRAAAPATYPGGLTRRQVTAWRNALFTVFGLGGLASASWVARVPAVRDALGATTAEMGLLLFGLAVGSIVGLTASSHVIARVGAREAVRWCVIAAAVGITLTGFGATVSPSFVVVFLGLLLLGASIGMWDVSMNVSGAANERVLGRAIMPIYHAFWSIGTMIGAALGGVAEHFRVPMVAHLGAIGVVMVVGVLVVARHFQSELLVGEGQAETPADDHSKTWRGRLSIWGQSQTILIGLVVLGMAFAEGSSNDWLALAMVDGHGYSNANGAFVFGVFVTAMTAGRLAGVSLLDRFGRVPVLRASAGLASVGLLIVIFTTGPVLPVVGVVLWGLGSSLGFPVGMSAAADDPRTAAARVSAVATIGYFAFLVGPPLIGFLGDRFGILNALLVVLVLVAVSGIVSYSTREPEKRPGTGTTSLD